MTTKKMPEQATKSTYLRITIGDRWIDMLFKSEDDALDVLKKLCVALSEADNTFENSIGIVHKKMP